jgi:hypothetical protein
LLGTRAELAVRGICFSLSPSAVIFVAIWDAGPCSLVALHARDPTATLNSSE